MEGEQHPQRAALRRTRELTIERLSQGFARDELSLDEFEQRIDRAYACGEEAGLQALLADLTPSAGLLRVAPAALAVAAGTVAPPRLALAVFGNVERRVRGAVPAHSLVLSVFGNVELDLRELQLPPGVTELRVRAVFGNVELTVPPTLAVECQGAPIFGSFSSVTRAQLDPGGPTLRIVGSAIFGNVEIKTLPRRELLEAPRSED